MFRQTYQSGLLSILSSQGSKPLQTWSCQVSNGYIKRMTDEQTKSLVIELISSNVSSTFITCPACPTDTLGIKMPFLNLYVKNLRRYFVMEIEVLDSQQMHRRFKISTFAMKTKIGPFGTHSPLNWIEGWNRLALNLQSFTKTVYGSHYVECRRITIHANCRIRRVFFADREYKEEELPLDYQIRCRIDQIKRQPSTRRAFEKKKFQYESKSETNHLPGSTTAVTTAPPIPPPPSAPTHLSTTFTEERFLDTPQGSMISEQEKKEMINDEDQMIREEINDLHLDSDQNVLDQGNYSTNHLPRTSFHWFDHQ